MLVVLVAALVIADAPAAAPQRTKLLVLDVQGAELEPAQRDTLTGTITARAPRFSSLDVLSSQDLRQLADLRSDQAAAGCEDAASSCMAELANALGAELVLATRAGKLDAVTVITLQLFEVKKGAAAAAVRSVAAAIDPAAIRQAPDAPFQEARQAVDLSQAERIVAVGRGIKGQEHLAVAEKLAAALGAELAASRPICDAGWLPMDRQIGSSGQTVAPKLYVALGISGAIQHLVGMKGSSVIVAVNKDPDAPIFEVADYGIVGDLFEVVPALVQALNG